jgi:V/A-type H+-transporting ATPase subunit E
VLDDTLEARLERLWPDAEAELATILFGEDGAPRRDGR